MKHLSGICLSLWLVACTSLDGQVATSADLLIRSAHIHTLDPANPTAQAIAIKDGQILALGTNQELAGLAGPQTRVLALNGQSLLPGLIDSHIHSIEGALALDACNLEDQQLSFDQLKAEVLACAQHEPGDWLQVQNLPSVGLALDSKRLDELLSHRPLFIISTDAHTAWANSLAMQLAGIDANTPNPPNGRIVRDAGGEATGVLIDGATSLVSKLLPPLPEAQKLAALEKTLQGFYQTGITAFLEANANAQSVQSFCSLAAQDKLKARLNLALGSAGAASEEEFQRLEGLRQQASDCGFTADTIKLYADGVIEYPTQSAALLAPYAGQTQGTSDWAGKLYMPTDSLQVFVLEAQRRGFNIHIHAIGDAAIQQALDAFALARAASDDHQARFSITHLQLIDPADYARFAQLDVLASMQLLWAQPDEYSVEAVLPYLGPERHARLYPAASLHRAGAQIAGGSDWNVSSFNPFEAMAVAISRTNQQAPQRGALNKAEALPLEAILQAYTVNSARLLGMENRIGQLKVGMAADLVILDRTLSAEMPPRVLAETQVLLTLIGGEVVYQKDLE